MGSAEGLSPFAGASEGAPQIQLFPFLTERAPEESSIGFFSASQCVDRKARSLSWSGMARGPAMATAAQANLLSDPSASQHRRQGPT